MVTVMSLQFTFFIVVCLSVNSVWILADLSLMETQILLVDCLKNETVLIQAPIKYPEMSYCYHADDDDKKDLTHPSP